MNAADRNRMYDTLAAVAKEFPEANLQLVAVGLGATTAVIQGDGLNITLEDCREGDRGDRSGPRD